MVLSVARAGTLLTSVVCMTIFVYNMVQPLGVSGDPYLEMVRDARPGTMPGWSVVVAPAAVAWHPFVQAEFGDANSMNLNHSKPAQPMANEPLIDLFDVDHHDLSSDCDQSGSGCSGFPLSSDLHSPAQPWLCEPIFNTTFDYLRLCPSRLVKLNWQSTRPRAATYATSAVSWAKMAFKSKPR